MGNCCLACYALAQFERSLIIGRTSEGRMHAKARSVRFGRKLKLTPYQISEALARREAGERLRPAASTSRTRPYRGSTLTQGGSRRGGLGLPPLGTDASARTSAPKRCHQVGTERWYVGRDHGKFTAGYQLPLPKNNRSGE